MSDSNIGWIDRDKMKAALEALRSNQRSPKRQREAASPNDDFVDLFGVERPAPFTTPEPESVAFIQPVDSEAKTPQFEVAGLANPDDLSPITAERAAPDFSMSEDALEEARIQEQMDAEQEAIELGRLEATSRKPSAQLDPWIRAVHAPSQSTSPPATTAPLETVEHAAFSQATTPSMSDVSVTAPQRILTPDEFSSAPTPNDGARSDDARGHDGLRAESQDADQPGLYEQEADAVRDFVNIGRDQSSSSQQVVSDDALSHVDEENTRTSDAVSHTFGRTFAVLRGDSHAHEARHADQEVGYESAIPELTRRATVEEPSLNFDDEFEDEERGLPTDELDLSLRASASPITSVTPVRDTMDITSSLKFDDSDFDSSQSDEADGSDDNNRPWQPTNTPDKPSTERASRADELGYQHTSAPEALPLQEDFRITPSDEPKDFPAHAKQNVFDDRRTLELPAVEDDAVTNQYKVDARPTVSAEDSSAQSTRDAAPVIRDGWISGGNSQPVSPAFEAVEATDDPFASTPSPAQSASVSDTGFSRVGAPAAQQDAGTVPSSSGFDQVSAAPVASGPRIEPQLLGVLRWRKAPRADDFTSVLKWLEGLGAWIADFNDGTEFFVGDESGLSLVETATSDGVIAVSVALRQSMSVLHRLHNEDAPGFTVFRHDNSRYMNILWTPTDHGILSVGIISDEVYPDERLEVLGKQLEHAVATLPFID